MGLRIAVTNKWLYHTSKCHDFFPLIKIYLINLNHSISLDQPLSGQHPRGNKVYPRITPTATRDQPHRWYMPAQWNMPLSHLSISARVAFERWHLQIAWDTMPVSCIRNSTVNEVFFKLKLIYSVVLVSGIDHSDSVILIYLSFKWSFLTNGF